MDERVGTREATGDNNILQRNSKETAGRHTIYIIALISTLMKTGQILDPKVYFATLYWFYGNVFNV